MKITWIIVGLIASSLFTSCVTMKKYEDLEASKGRLQREVARLQKVETECDELSAKHQKLEQEHSALKSAYENLEIRFKNLETANTDLLKQYDELLDQKTAILTSSSQERKALSEELAKKEKELDKKESQLAKTERELAEKQLALEELTKSLDEREARIKDMNRRLNAQNDLMSSLKATISDALMGFSDEDLTVTQKNGKVYVSLSQNLLFAKGSDVIDSKGKDAIQKVGNVLKGKTDIEINVEGHTDTDGDANRNWDLSVTRATSVVKLLSKSGVDPKRITASGRSFYVPVAPNDVESNKSKNRRTEIILAPKLDELFRLISE
jgi:chemotaxis protein MotB